MCGRHELQLKTARFWSAQIRNRVSEHDLQLKTARFWSAQIRHHVIDNVIDMAQLTPERLVAHRFGLTRDSGFC